ncbi:M14 family zinc carboxypeptidase [Halorussus halophilus]|uniref:M14 family zinc carboxypeptidase n=1 Tax=Halorussus halophilus TaxID=2650975 RepID=UPI001300FBE5|nr:M14 family zinc carboxypeptidase [Halorussus halophilus]
MTERRTNGGDETSDEFDLTRRDFARLSAATAGALTLPGAASSEASAATLTSGKMTKRYEFVVNHTADDFAVGTLIELTSEAGFAELDALGIDYRSTTASGNPHAHAQLATGEVGDVLDLSVAERLSHSPGSNPFWRLGQYPNGVFPEPRQSTDFIDYEQMVDGLNHLESQHPDRLKFYSIGESPGHYNYVTGEDDPKDIYVAELTNNVNDDAAFEDKEKVMFSLSLHGLERAGAEAGSRFIEDVLTGEDSDVADLLDDIVVVFVYANADGWVAKHPQYESGWQLLGPDGGAPVAPFYERGNDGVFDTNRQAPSVGWIDPGHYPGDPLGANLTDDEPGIDSDVPDYASERVPDLLAVAEHFRDYENLNYGADLHGALTSSKFVLGLISQDQFDHGQLHELYEFNRNIDETLEDALTEWTTLADAQQTLTGEFNPEVIGFETLPEEAFDYAGIWDTIGYTVSGGWLDWMAQPEELGGLGMTTMDFEMAYSHMVGANAYDPELVNMQVVGYDTAIKTITRYVTEQTTADIETGGASTAYVTTDSLTRSSEDLSFVQNPDTGFVEMDAGEQFSGTIGPGATGAEATKRHEFTAVADADRIEADLSWTPPGEDLEFYLEDSSGDRIATAATASNPETITASVEAGKSYTFVVETYANVAADYTIDGTYFDYGQKETSRETDEQSAMVGPNQTTELYRSVREEVDTLSVSVNSQPGSHHAATLRTPSGEVVRSFDPTDGEGGADGFVGMPEWTVDDPATGEWTVEATNLMESKDGEVGVRFGTLQSNEQNPDPVDALGYEQRSYEVSPFAFFEDYAGYADAPVDALTISDVKDGAHHDYDNLVVIHDDAISDSTYVDALDQFVADDGNLVLTDSGLRLLAPMANEFAADIDHDHVTEETFYIANVEQKYPGHELLEDTRPIQRELWKIAPMGYSTSNQAPMHLLDGEAFDAAGGTVAGETAGKVSVGSLTPDRSTGTGIHVLGSLLPPASQSNLHPFGLLDYTVAFFGHTILTNALGYKQNRYVNGSKVSEFGDVGSFSVDPSVTATRSDDGDLFTGGQTNQVDISVAGNADVLIRDQFPSEWTVEGGDSHSVYTDDDTRYVEFDTSVEDGTRTYFAEAPGSLTETQSYEFGPVEYSLDGGENWVQIPKTTDRNNVLGADSNV